MKLSLPVKLGIFIVLLFAVVVVVCLAWTPLKIKYYANKYSNATTPQERIRIVDILCNLSEPGRKALYTVFRDFCISEQVKIPGGSFIMGSELGQDEHDSADERPVHKVTLSSFWIDKFEVTNEKYYVFTKITNYSAPEGWKNGKFPQGFESHAVESVLWKDAKAYCDWLEMKIPSEARWEYACRAGTVTPFHFGNSITIEQVNFSNEKGPGTTVSVGSYPPNNWNLYDMHGNVWEWCLDWYGYEYYTNSPANDPEGPDTGRDRVIRGGSWRNPAWVCGSAQRNLTSPDTCSTGVGFRCVREIGK